MFMIFQFFRQLASSRTCFLIHLPGCKNLNATDNKDLQEFELQQCPCFPQKVQGFLHGYQVNFISPSISHYFI